MLSITYDKDKLLNLKERIPIIKNSDTYMFTSGMGGQIYDMYLGFQPGIFTFGQVFSYNHDAKKLHVQYAVTEKDIYTIFKEHLMVSEKLSFPLWDTKYSDVIEPFTIWSISRNSGIMSKVSSGNVSYIDMISGLINIDNDIKTGTHLSITLSKKNLDEFYTKKMFKYILDKINGWRKEIKNNKTYLITNNSGKKTETTIYDSLNIILSPRINLQSKTGHILKIWFNEIGYKLFSILLSYYLKANSIWFKSINVELRFNTGKKDNLDDAFKMVSLFDLDKSLRSYMKTKDDEHFNLPYMVYSLARPGYVFFTKSKETASFLLGALKYDKGIGSLDVKNSIYTPCIPCGLSLWEDYYWFPIMYNDMNYDRDTNTMNFKDIDPVIINLQNKIEKILLKDFGKLKNNPKQIEANKDIIRSMGTI